MEKYCNLIRVCPVVISFLFFYSGNVYGQWKYIASKAQYIAGTYTDLGTSGAAITTNFAGGAMTFDNANSSVQNIGFNFSYNGLVFSQFVLNSNGFIKLGNTAPATNNFDVLSSADINTIAPFNYDLRAGTLTPEYRVFTSGSSGSRICTIQFENLRDGATSQYNNINFQVKLYETTNMIEFVYGSFAASGAAAAFKEMIVGIKGSDSTFSVNASKSSADLWNTTTFINGVYPAPNTKFNNRNNVLPATGTIFRFNAINDAKVEVIYSLSQLPIPAANPHTIQARIKNTGGTTLNNVPVTVVVTGENNFTNTQFVTLDPQSGTLVNFASFYPNRVGTNTITVSVTVDDSIANNEAVIHQGVNANTYSYIDAAGYGWPIGFGTSDGLLLAKYSLSGTDTVSKVSVYLGQVGTGNTIYGVVLDASGTIVAQSDPYVTQQGDDQQQKEFFINNCPGLTNTDFYVGIAQTANATTPYYILSTQPEQAPTRPGAYYFAGLGGGSPAEVTDLGRFMISAVLNSTTVPPNEFNYTAGHCVAMSGTYSDLGTLGTAIITNHDGAQMTYDDDNSSVQNIGFNFPFNGTTYTQFILNSNGFIKLGNTPGVAQNYDVLTSVDKDVIAPFSYDLDAGTATPEYRVLTTGAPGSRVCTIQFKNVREWSAPQQYNNISFQIKLYESNSNIEFVYGIFTSSGAVAQTESAVVGIKGATFLYPQQAVNATKPATTAWTSATFIDGHYPASTKFDNRNNVLPAMGTTLRFRSVKDAKVDVVYTLSKVPMPVGVYNHVIKAKVTNPGSVNLINYPITLNITGANPFTNIKSIAALPPDDSVIVEFDPVSLWNAGTNTVTVSVPSDDVNTNNSASYQQLVNDSIYSYADASAPTGAAGFNTNEGVLLAQFYANQANILVTGVRIHISNSAANVGRTVKGVVGSLFSSDYTYSDPYVITAGDLGTYKTFTFNQPVSFRSDIGGDADFVAGLYQSPSVLGFNPVSYQNEGTPCRPDVFYKRTTGGSLQDFTQGRLMIEAIAKVDNAVPQPPIVTLLGWNFTGLNSPASAAATTYHPFLISSNLLTRGSGAPASPGINSFMTTGFQNNGISTTNTDYFQFQIAPGPGDTMSLYNVSLDDGGDEDFNAYPGGVNRQLAYSLNGTNFTLIGSPINSNFDGDDVTLENIPALQNLVNGTTVTFRYYASGSNAVGAWGFVNYTSNYEALEVTGTIRNQTIIAAPVPPSGADFYLPTCSSTGTGSVSFTSWGVFGAGNIYTAKMNTTQWSDDTTAVVLGTLASTANSGTINIIIPAGTPPRIGYPRYHIWIEASTAPGAISTSSGYFAVKRDGYCPTANNYFRTRQSGNWNDVNTWEISPDNTTWYTSPLFPDKQALGIVIRQPDSVTLTIPVGIHNMTLFGKLTVLNGGANSGSLMFYKNRDNSILRDLRHTMQIDSSGTLQVVSASAIFDSVIKRAPNNNSGATWIRNFGKITIGDGSAANAAGFHNFTNRPGEIIFYDESVFEWNSTSAFGPPGDMTYFYGNNHPILRLTRMPANFGSPANTIVNGILEINTPVTMDGSGIKEFRDGITGTSVLSQAANSGEFRVVSAYAELPETDTSGGIIGILSGHLTVNLSNGGLILRNGARLIDGADILITGSGISKGKIEVVPSARMTLDPSAVLTIENADLLNDGIIDGAGKIQFTGPDTSQLSSPGIINAKLELSTKQLRLISHSTTSSIDLLGGSHLRLDSFHLNMRTGNLAGDSTNFIVTNDTGRLSRNVPSDPLVEVPFHVGISENSYTPVSISNSGIADNFSVRVKAGVFDSLNNPMTSGNVNRTWLVADALEGGSNVKLKMQWKASDEQPVGFNRNHSYISRLKVCPLPRNCSGALYDLGEIRAASDLGQGYYTMERSSIDSFRTNSFIVTSTPFIFRFTGSGEWADSINWTPGIPAPYTIVPGMEVIIDPKAPPDGTGECIIRHNILITQPGKLTVLPGKKLTVRLP